MIGYQAVQSQTDEYHVRRVALNGAPLEATSICGAPLPENAPAMLVRLP